MERKGSYPQKTNTLSYYLTIFISGQPLQDIRNGKVCIDPGSIQLQQSVRAQGFLEGLCRDPCSTDAGPSQPQVFTVPKHTHCAVVQQTYSRVNLSFGIKHNLKQHWLFTQGKDLVYWPSVWSGFHFKYFPQVQINIFILIGIMVTFYDPMNNVCV